MKKTTLAKQIYALGEYLNAVRLLLVKRMQFVTGTNRHQTWFTTTDEQVSTDNAVRLMHAFIDKLGLRKLAYITQ